MMIKTHRKIILVYSSPHYFLLQGFIPVAELWDILEGAG